MFILTIASCSISYAFYGGALFFYLGAFLMGIAQALVYPTLITFLSFVLESENRNVLLGLFIAMADLGVSLGSIIMGPVADEISYNWMYVICTVLALGLIAIAYEHRKIFIG